jgi:hypothetical protein
MKMRVVTLRLDPYSGHLYVEFMLYFVITSSFDCIRWPQNTWVGCWIEETQWHIKAEYRCHCLPAVMSRACFLFTEGLAYSVVMWVRVCMSLCRLLRIVSILLFVSMLGFVPSNNFQINLPYLWKGFHFLYTSRRWNWHIPNVVRKIILMSDLRHSLRWLRRMSSSGI